MWWAIVFTILSCFSADSCLSLPLNADVTLHSSPRTSSLALEDSSDFSQWLGYGSCCKICRKSQACGDSCIPWHKTCHKGPGCACQREVSNGG
jgi:hypothetical protein